MTVTTYAQITPRRTAITLKSIWYSQTSINAFTKRRSDCSGLLSYVWDLPMTGAGTYLGAFSTTTLYSQGLIVEIPFADLKVGDAIGHCGPNSAGNNGHIALWLGYGDGTTPKSGGNHHVWDHGSGWGPNDRWVQWNGTSTGWLHPDNLKAWRLYTLAGGTPTPPEDGMADWAAAIQTSLKDAGYDIGSTGVDGSWGPKSRAALTQAFKDAKRGGSLVIPPPVTALPDHVHSQGNTGGVVA